MLIGLMIELNRIDECSGGVPGTQCVLGFLPGAEAKQALSLHGLEAVDWKKRVLPSTFSPLLPS